MEHSLRLPPSPHSPMRARQLLRQVLDACSRSDWRDAAELALSELTTNAVLHAHTEMTVRIRCGPRDIRFEVEDSNPAGPAPRTYYGTEASTGRGLALVAALAHDHGIERTATGKVVWFVLRDASLQPTEQDLGALLDAWSDEDVREQAAEPAPGGRTVTLAGFPPTLWLAAHEMHDALLREMALYRAGQGADTGDLAAADRVRFAIRAALDHALAHEGAQARARSPLPAGHPARLELVPPTLDLEVVLGPDASADAATLQDVLDEANRLSSQGRLLTRPALPEIVAVQDWAAEQIISSTSGQAPLPWTGADAERFSQELDHAVREFDYDVLDIVEGSRTAIVVDSQNRILGISQALASEIGWDVDDLVGRRVVAIVPPHFREAHVAGLTRHLSTGTAHALRVALQLPVLRADGSEILCDFWIDTDRSRSGQPVYIAYVSPVQQAVRE